MLTFLFWNLAGRNIAPVVAALALEHTVDILLLAENDTSPAELLRLLNPPGAVRYNFVPAPIKSKVDIFFGFAPQFIQPQTDTGRASIRKITLPGRLEFLLCAVHFQSLMVWEAMDQAFEAVHLNEIIRNEEQRAQCMRTLVVGDLNMNPFAPGMTGASGFNAVMTRDVVSKGDRELAERKHPFFFNPMWSQFSDGTSGPGGTYFRNPSGYSSIYWHMLDQVLLRPALLPHFDHLSLRILHEYKQGKLVKENGRPSVSDHLPITFRLNL